MGRFLRRWWKWLVGVSIVNAIWIPIVIIALLPHDHERGVGVNGEILGTKWNVGYHICDHVAPCLILTVTGDIGQAPACSSIVPKLGPVDVSTHVSLGGRATFIYGPASMAVSRVLLTLEDGRTIPVETHQGAQRLVQFRVYGIALPGQVKAKYAMAQDDKGNDLGRIDVKPNEEPVEPFPASPS